MNMEAASSGWDMDNDIDDYKYDSDSDLNDSEKEELEVALYSQLYFQSGIDLDYDINKNLNQNLENDVSITAITPVSVPLSIESSSPTNVNVDNGLSFNKSLDTVNKKTSSMTCTKLTRLINSNNTFESKGTDSVKGKKDKLAKKQNRSKKKKNKSEVKVQGLHKNTGDLSIKDVVNVSSSGSEGPVTLSSDNSTDPDKDIVMQISSSTSQQSSKSYSSVEICVQDSSDSDSELGNLSEDSSVILLQSKGQDNDDINLLNVCDNSNYHREVDNNNVCINNTETDCSDIHWKKCDDQSITENWSIIDDDRFSRGFQTRRYFKSNVCCHNCSETGHIAKNCQKPKKQFHCILCGLAGHWFSRCPWSICYKCNAPVGHTAVNCTMKLPPPWNVTCIRCLAKGHRQKDCPESWRQYHLTTRPGDPEPANLQVNPRVFCCNCAKEGHFHFECTEKTMLGVRAVPHSPFVTKYDKLNTDTNNRTRSTSDLENNNNVILTDIKEAVTSSNAPDEKTLAGQCDDVTNTDGPSENAPAEHTLKVDADMSIGTRSGPIKHRKHRKRKINGCVSDATALDKKQKHTNKIAQGVHEASQNKVKKKRAKAVTDGVHDQECESALIESAESITKTINASECETETSEIPVKKKKKLSKILNGVISDKECVSDTLVDKKGRPVYDINRNVLETETSAVSPKKKKRKIHGHTDSELAANLCELAQRERDSIKQTLLEVEISPIVIEKKRKKSTKTMNVDGIVDDSCGVKLKKKIKGIKTAGKDKGKDTGKPEKIQVKDKSEKLKKKSKPEKLVVNNELEESMVNENPEKLKVNEKPEKLKVNDKPEKLKGKDKPEKLKGKDKPEKLKRKSKPEKLVVNNELEELMVNENPEKLKVNEKPKKLKVNDKPEKLKGKDKADKLKKTKKVTAPVNKLFVKKVKKRKLTDVNQQDLTLCAKVDNSTEVSEMTESNSIAADKVELRELNSAANVIVISDDDIPPEMKKSKKLKKSKRKIL